MDNDLPWNPHEPQQRPQIPKTCPQVPDVTLFSPTNRASNNVNNKTNFLQRAIATEKILAPKQTNIQSTAPSSHAYNNELFSKPSVPDLSLIQPQVLTSSNRLNGPSNLLFSKNGGASNENVFGAVGKPSVPDLTILDEEPKQKVKLSDRIFGESYKKQLLNSHEQFMKQIRTDSPTAETANGKNISPLFRPQPTKYQENPLRKYAPKQQSISYGNDGNSSSILIDIDNQPSSLESGDKSDEMTFKKVAEMLCEIQKLVIPGKVVEQATQALSQGEKTPTSSSQRCVVLKKLASAYLTTEEFEYFDVEKELREIESNS